MSTKRSVKAPYHKKDEAGRLLCRGGCGTFVPKGKIYWCADPACLDGYLVRSNPQHARKRVEERDHGICSACGLDTEKLKRVLRRLRKRSRVFNPEKCKYEVRSGCSARLAAAIERAYPWANRPGHLWEMDHIVPVVEGGGGCGLDNLRTLCLGDHRKATAALAARRAAARRGAGQERLL